MVEVPPLGMLPEYAHVTSDDALVHVQPLPTAETKLRLLGS